MRVLNITQRILFCQQYTAVGKSFPGQVGEFVAGKTGSSERETSLNTAPEAAAAESRSVGAAHPAHSYSPAAISRKREAF